MPLQVLKRRFFLVLICLCAASPIASAQVITPDSIDRLVEHTLKTFDVPGIAVAIVKDDFRQGLRLRFARHAQKG